MKFQNSKDKEKNPKTFHDQEYKRWKTIKNNGIKKKRTMASKFQVNARITKREDKDGCLLRLGIQG